MTTLYKVGRNVKWNLWNKSVQHIFSSIVVGGVAVAVAAVVAVVARMDTFAVFFTLLVIVLSDTQGMYNFCHFNVLVPFRPRRRARTALPQRE